jgi:hypothetical protein
MAQRITDSMLTRKVELINSIMGAPAEHYSAPGQVNPGHYYVSFQYGGVALYQAGANGDRNVFSSGHVTKAMLYAMMDAYIEGLRDMYAREHLGIGKK